MRFFLKKMILFLLLIASLFLFIFATIQCLPPQFTTSDHAALLDKYNRLCSIDDPKIILLGGSSLTFGMDSPSLEKAIQMPVVNLGLHASIKPAFYLNLSKDNLNAGDVVVLCFEYVGYSDYHSIPFDFLYTLENYPQFWKAVPLHEYKYLAADYLDQYALKKIARMINHEDRPETITNPEYRRSAFNAWGDNIAPRPNPRNQNFTLQYTFRESSLGPRIIKHLNEYYKYAQKQGAKVFISFPPIAKNSILYDEEKITQYQSSLNEKLNIPIISNITDYIYDDCYFYDTYYHLNEHGVSLRTEQLRKDLTAALQNNIK